MSKTVELPARLSHTLIELVETHKECDRLVSEEYSSIKCYTWAHTRVHAIDAQIRKLDRNRDTYTDDRYQSIKADLLGEKEVEASRMRNAREEVKQTRLKIKKAVKLFAELKKQWKAESSKITARS